MSGRLPFAIVGDSPALNTGLARIARELTGQIWQSREELGLEVVQIGWGARDGWRGVTNAVVPWPYYEFEDLGADWGCGTVLEAWRQAFGAQASGVIFTVWDPARCYPFVERVKRQQLWGYFAVDGENPHGKLSGPAFETLNRYQRVLAYGRYGAQVIQRTIGKGVSYLPHGLSSQWFEGLAKEPSEPVIGIVATNQPRKDLALALETATALTRDGGSIALVIDIADGRHWSVTQLAEDYGCNRRLAVYEGSTWSDAWMRRFYDACTLTLAPGLGEGFGYPIVESLARGRPVLHGDYAGGVEYLPAGWRIIPDQWRTESVFNIRRPVFDARGWKAIGYAVMDDEGWSPALLQGSVAHLRWDRLWAYWRQWIQDGLRERT